MSSAWIFCRLRVPRSVDSSREDPAQEGCLGGGCGGDSGTVMGEISQGTDRKWCQLIFLQSLGVSSGSWLLTCQL